MPTSSLSWTPDASSRRAHPATCWRAAVSMPGGRPITHADMRAIERLKMTIPAEGSHSRIEEVEMSPTEITRAWKDCAFRDSLTDDQRALLPAHPAGASATNG